MDEFDLIGRYFEPLQLTDSNIKLGIGDDAAIVDLTGNHSITTAVDTLVEGVHFPIGMEASAIGYRSLAVNLSDFAAVGATPKYATLALTLPAIDPEWLQAFADGVGQALREADISLIGGDTCEGALTITIQLIGTIDGAPMRRQDAKAGDILLVSGTLGDARAGLELMKSLDGIAESNRKALIERFKRPQARLTLGAEVRSYANAAIDLSDGLLADVGHVMASSGCSAEIEVDRLPISNEIRAVFGRERALEYAIAGGDDYELVLTVPPRYLDRVMQISTDVSVSLTAVGRVIEGSGVVCLDGEGQQLSIELKGYRHFT